MNKLQTIIDIIKNQYLQKQFIGLSSIETLTFQDLKLRIKQMETFDYLTKTDMQVLFTQYLKLQDFNQDQIFAFLEEVIPGVTPIHSDQENSESQLPFNQRIPQFIRD